MHIFLHILLILCYVTVLHLPLFGCVVAILLKSAFKILRNHLLRALADRENVEAIVEIP